MLIEVNPVHGLLFAVYAGIVLLKVPHIIFKANGGIGGVSVP
jgi:hypothetical protein